MCITELLNDVTVSFRAGGSSMKAEAEEFLREALMMRDFEHAHVLNLIGQYTHTINNFITLKLSCGRT